MWFLFRYEAAGDRGDLATSTKKEFIASEAYRNVNTIFISHWFIHPFFVLLSISKSLSCINFWIPSFSVLLQ